MGNVVTGTQIIDKALETLEDTVGGAFAKTQGLAWLNEGQRAICFLKPDAKSGAVVEQMNVGTKQSLPAGSRRLLGIVRNMGPDGLTPGKAVRGPISQQHKDGFNPNWHADAGAATIDEFIYDIRTPDIYWVYPPATTSAYLELLTAQEPTDVAAEANVIDIGDIYEMPLVEWILYRFLSRFGEETPEGRQANTHLATFQALLGVKTQIDQLIDPREQRRGGSRD